MQVIARLAPSPTGLMHIGNAWAFMLAWLGARSMSGKIFLRFDDIDPLRSSEESAHEIMSDLEWLGIDWDGVPYFQSKRSELYQKVLDQLDMNGRVYQCFCTRKELRTIAGAPHVDDRGAPYPGTCRNLTDKEREQKIIAGKKPVLRFNTLGLPLCQFDDLVYGTQVFSLDDCGGDFPLLRSDGVWAYQLASSVDDMDMGITHIVRGRDILPSTPRQLAIFDAIHAEHPVFAHIPLICDIYGCRLAKRHEKDLSIQKIRNAGIRAENIIGLLAYLAHLKDTPAPCLISSLVDNFSYNSLPKSDILFNWDVLET